MCVSVGVCVFVRLLYNDVKFLAFSHGLDVNVL